MQRINTECIRTRFISFRLLNPSRKLRHRRDKTFNCRIIICCENGTSASGRVNEKLLRKLIKQTTSHSFI